jgi:PAS domain S-box-containing protein
VSGWTQQPHQPQVETITPVARDTVVDHMIDGVMVVSSQNRVTDLNPAAASLLGLRAANAIGRSLARVLANHPTLVTRYYDDQDLPVEIATGEGETERHYDVHFSRIDQQHDQAAGQLIVFRDVTARVREEASRRQAEAETQRRLQEQNEQAQRELVELRRAKNALRKLNAGLESRVDARTADLTRINTELAREIEERIQAAVELRRRNRELLSLQSAMAATVSSLDLPFVLDTVTWEMVNLLGVDDCIISEWDAQADTLSVIAEYNSGNEIHGTAGGISYNLADFPLKKRALMERCAQQISVSQADVDSGEFTHMKDDNVKTLLILPMVFQSRVVGLVELRNRWAERTLTDRDITLAQFLTDQAAVAMENAQLYERAQREIAERKRAEEQIMASLKEKEVLLQEIHHRVKNNLQVVSSLLSLQSNYVENEAALDMFEESQNRILSMALIHEKLYRSQDLARIDLAEYIQTLAGDLVRSYRARSGPVKLNVHAAGVFLSIDKAVPCGLIVNELVSNALKHAFPSNGNSPTNGTDIDNEIRIDLSADAENRVTLLVGDNGVGFPQDLDVQTMDSLGLRLVHTLVSQLEGTLELQSDKGAKFRLAFSEAPG